MQPGGFFLLLLLFSARRQSFATAFFDIRASFSDPPSQYNSDRATGMYATGRLTDVSSLRMECPSWGFAAHCRAHLQAERRSVLYALQGSNYSTSILCVTNGHRSQLSTHSNDQLWRDLRQFSAISCFFSI